MIRSIFIFVYIAVVLLFSGFAQAQTLSPIQNQLNENLKRTGEQPEQKFETEVSFTPLYK
ncbi:MAG: hypothetical protein NDI61_04960 [Bdellovibrionaceae bacterium]|nr:hypothetical protein [Pseudobdellovibrionaceae bacterium]